MTTKAKREAAEDREARESRDQALDAWNAYAPIVEARAAELEACGLGHDEAMRLAAEEAFPRGLVEAGQ